MHTQSTHTPGPWTINGGRIQNAAQYGEPTYVEIATVGMVNDQSDVNTANARLIAAAPDLLAAGEAVTAAFERPASLLAMRVPAEINLDMIKALVALVDAIAKARGQ